jgi:hypothetical protein
MQTGGTIRKPAARSLNDGARVVIALQHTVCRKTVGNATSKRATTADRSRIENPRVSHTMQPIGCVLRLASRLNDWLYRTLGPPYGVLLSVGLALEIVRHAREAIQHAGPDAAWHLLPILLNIALLLHTAGDLQECLAKRSERRLAR